MSEDGQVREDREGEDARAMAHRSVGNEPVRFSSHARLRAARRNVVPDAVAYVLAYGRVLHRTGITFHFLAARDVPAEDRHTTWVVRLVGTVVLVGPDGEIITVYRNRRALPAIRRKLKYRFDLRATSFGVDGDDDAPVRWTA